MKTAVTTSPTAYSYIRFSSKKQEEGDSIRRQTELTSTWAKTNKIHLDTSVQPDRGVSAFRGKNQDIGALGAFLRLVESGRVLPGSYLVVESLDRLTREEIQPALLLVLTLLQKGIRVVQLKPVEMIYDAKSDTTPIILMLVELSRGHSESKVKSDRVHEAWNERRKDARKGGILTHKLPLWVEDRGGKLVAIPERAKIVKRIFELSASGTGLFSIMNTLKAEKVPAFGSSGRWSISYLDLILKDRRALGEFQPKLRGGVSDGKPISDYYPVVVTEELWKRSRQGAALRHRKPKNGDGRKGGRIGERVNVFQGLLKSARDGFSYTCAAASAKNPHPVIRAAGNRLGAGRCESFPLLTFEEAVLSRLREIDPHDILNGETRDESIDLAGELAAVEASIASIVADMDANGESPTLFKRLRTKEAEQRTLSAKLAEARQKGAHPLSESWGEAQSLLAALEAAPNQREARLRLREALRRIVLEIRILVVPRGRDRLAAVQIWFTCGAHGPRHRDYLIVHRAAHSGGNLHQMKRPSSWSVKSFAARTNYSPSLDAPELTLPAPGTVDLRERQYAAQIERAILALDLETGRLADGADVPTNVASWFDLLEWQ